MNDISLVLLRWNEKEFRKNSIIRKIEDYSRRYHKENKEVTEYNYEEQKYLILAASGVKQ